MSNQGIDTEEHRIARRRRQLIAGTQARLFTQIGQPVAVAMDDDAIFYTTVKYLPWQSHSGEWLIALVGMSGGYEVTRVVPCNPDDQLEHWHWYLPLVDIDMVGDVRHAAATLSRLADRLEEIYEWPAPALRMVATQLSAAADCAEPGVNSKDGEG